MKDIFDGKIISEFVVMTSIYDQFVVMTRPVVI